MRFGTVKGHRRPDEFDATATTYASAPLGCYRTPSGQSIGGMKVPLGRVPTSALGRYALGEAREAGPEAVLKDREAPFLTEEDLEKVKSSGKRALEEAKSESGKNLLLWVGAAWLLFGR